MNWRKASGSMSNGNCVEVAAPGAVLGFTGAAWTAFLGAVKGGAV